MNEAKGIPELSPEMAFDLLRRLDFYAGKREGASSSPLACMDDTRAALADHVRAAIVRGSR